VKRKILHIGEKEDMKGIEEAKEYARKNKQRVSIIWVHTQADPPFDRDFVVIDEEGNIEVSCAEISMPALSVLDEKGTLGIKGGDLCSM
jgi:hypothetical protein